VPRKQFVGRLLVVVSVDDVVQRVHGRVRGFGPPVTGQLRVREHGERHFVHGPMGAFGNPVLPLVAWGRAFVGDSLIGKPRIEVLGHIFGPVVRPKDLHRVAGLTFRPSTNLSEVLPLGGTTGRPDELDDHEARRSAHVDPVELVAARRCDSDGSLGV